MSHTLSKVCSHPLSRLPGLTPVHYIMNSYYSEIDDMPDEDQLCDVMTINDSDTGSTQRTTIRAPLSVEKDDANVLVGTSYPPVPNKLIKKIRDGEFIEMADLLPERLGAGGDNEPTKSTKKRKIVTNILEWVRCFGLYISIIAHSTPERVPDLLSYQAFIIDAYTEYQGDYWSGYDRQFRQRAAVTPTTSWSTMDTTLWNLAFGSCISLPRSTHCLSVSHKSGNVSYRLTLTHHLPHLFIPLKKQHLVVPGFSVQFAMHGMKIQLQVAHTMAIGLSIYVIYTLRM